MPTLTFVATANAVVYVGATPVFVDADPATWNIDPDAAAPTSSTSRAARRPACRGHRHRRPLRPVRRLRPRSPRPAPTSRRPAHRGRRRGARAPPTADGRPGRSAGSACFSFNGNKIITTSGGGMLVSDDGDLVDRARHLATQAREPAPHYEHTEIGYNYRLSNLLAARRPRPAASRSPASSGAPPGDQGPLPRRRWRDVPGIAFMPDAHRRRRRTTGSPCITVDPDALRRHREDVRAHARGRTTSRPARSGSRCTCQPVSGDQPVCGGAVAERIFATGPVPAERVAASPPTTSSASSRSSSRCDRPRPGERERARRFLAHPVDRAAVGFGWRGAHPGALADQGARPGRRRAPPGVPGRGHRPHAVRRHRGVPACRGRTTSSTSSPRTGSRPPASTASVSGTSGGPSACARC